MNKKLFLLLLVAVFFTGCDYFEVPKFETISQTIETKHAENANITVSRGKIDQHLITTLPQFKLTYMEKLGDVKVELIRPKLNYENPDEYKWYIHWEFKRVCKTKEGFKNENDCPFIMCKAGGSVTCEVYVVNQLTGVQSQEVLNGILL